MPCTNRIVELRFKKFNLSITKSHCWCELKDIFTKQSEDYLDDILRELFAFSTVREVDNILSHILIAVNYRHSHILKVLVAVVLIPVEAHLSLIVLVLLCECQHSERYQRSLILKKQQSPKTRILTQS